MLKKLTLLLAHSSKTAVPLVWGTKATSSVFQSSEVTPNDFQCPYDSCSSLQAGFFFLRSEGSYTIVVSLLLAWLSLHVKGRCPFSRTICCWLACLKDFLGEETTLVRFDFLAAVSFGFCSGKDTEILCLALDLFPSDTSLYSCLPRVSLTSLPSSQW